MDKVIRDWSLTSLKEELIRIGMKVLTHERYVAFQMAEVTEPKISFARLPGARIPGPIADLRPRSPPLPA